MSITVEIGKMTKEVNSTKNYMDNSDVHSCNFKEDTSIVHPHFTISTTHKITDYERYNYCKISNSYYWIDDIKDVRKGVVDVTCARDPLATFRTNIGNYECVISRCNASDHYNLFDNDDIFPPTNKNWDSVNIQIGGVTGFTYTPQDGTIGVISFYGSAGVVNVITNQIDLTLEELMQPQDLWDVLRYGFTQPGNFVKSALVLPFDPDVTPGSVVTKVGNESITLSQVEQIGENERIYTKSDSADISTLISSISIFNSQTQGADTMNDYRRFNDNYVQLSVKMPFVGVIQIPADVLSYDKLYWSYYIDKITGSGEALLYASKTGNTVQRLLNKSSIRVGASIPITSTTSALIPLIQSAVSKNAIGVMDKMLNPTDVTMTGSTDSVGYWDIGTVNLLVNIRKCDNIIDYRATKGVPTNKKMKIKDVYGTDRSGYIEVLNPSVSIQGATHNELQQINSYLQGGFYYE